MARGRKKFTLDEQLQNITTQIKDVEKTLKELKEQKKDIEAQIKESRLAELDDLIAASGKSFEEVKKFLEK